MNPGNKQQQQSSPCPTTYDEYLGLCQNRGVDPQLDQPLFEAVIQELAPLRDAEKTRNAEAIACVHGLSEEEVLQRLGASLHLDELLNHKKSS
jgi:hypothetical protein